MTATITEAGGPTVLWLDADGPLLAGEQDVSDVLSEAFSTDADWIAMPVSRLADGFLDLSTRQAGRFIQKIINYQLSVAFIGDISARVDASSALRDFVRESNRGPRVWFMATRSEFEARLDQISSKDRYP